MIKCVFTYISIFLKVYMKIDLNNALNNISEKKRDYLFHFSLLF